MIKYYTIVSHDITIGTSVFYGTQYDDALSDGMVVVKPEHGDTTEITEGEYLVWKERIANPDMKTYFPGIFPSIGVVDKATRKMIDTKQAKGYKAYCEQQCEAQRINFKLAQRDAEAIGEDHEAVFTSKHPQVGEDVKAMLFTEVRAASLKLTKKAK
jgi:hypothetical protein